MTTPDTALVVRPCRMRDAGAAGDLLELCWHSTYDPILGAAEATRSGERAYSRASIRLGIAYSLISRSLTMLLATRRDIAVGYAAAQSDEEEVVLYGLYVHPECKAQGIGSALLDAVVARYPTAKAIRLEVLKANSDAVAWYEAKGFETYGETPHATGTENVPAVYMDKKLVRSMNHAV